jgi:hypothetical protein
MNVNSTLLTRCQSCEVLARQTVPRETPEWNPQLARKKRTPTKQGEKMLFGRSKPTPAPAFSWRRSGRSDHDEGDGSQTHYPLPGIPLIISSSPSSPAIEPRPKLADDRPLTDTQKSSNRVYLISCRARFGLISLAVVTQNRANLPGFAAPGRPFHRGSYLPKIVL